jgi:hypothetical protein
MALLRSWFVSPWNRGIRSLLSVFFVGASPSYSTGPEQDAVFPHDNGSPWSPMPML